tara:strand:- start:140372 stop:141181 length:810 start_codon:yes stop_codon:yes gene_type:complete
MYSAPYIPLQVTIASVADHWTFPVLLKMSRDVDPAHKHNERVWAVFPTFEKAIPYASVINGIALPRYDAAGKELDLTDMLALARDHLVHQLSRFLLTGAGHLQELVPHTHADYAEQYPALYQGSDNVSLYKERITLRPDELDYTYYEQGSFDFEKFDVVNLLAKELLDDVTVSAFWHVDFTPNRLVMRREHLTVSLIGHTVSVEVGLPHTQKCALDFDLWETVRLYSILRRRHFRENARYEKRSAKYTGRSTFYALRLLKSTHRNPNEL